MVRAKSVPAHQLGAALLFGNLVVAETAKGGCCAPSSASSLATRKGSPARKVLSRGYQKS
jgi:hypothetical protein